MLTLEYWVFSSMKWLIPHPVILEWSPPPREVLSTHSESPIRIVIFCLEYRQPGNIRHLRKASNTKDRQHIRHTLKEKKKQKAEEIDINQNIGVGGEKALKSSEMKHYALETRTGCNEAKRDNQRLRRRAWELQVQCSNKKCSSRFRQ